MQRLSLGALVQRLSALPGPTLDPASVSAALVEVTLVSGTLAPHLWFRREGYTRNLVHRDARFEVLVLCWWQGTASPVHDHAGQDCWLRVEQGVLGLENHPLLEGGRVPGHARLGASEGVQVAWPGSVDRRTREEGVHRVRVLEGPAVSVHVYSRPAVEVLVFDLCHNRCVARPMRDDSVNGVPLPGAGELVRLDVETSAGAEGTARV